MDSLIVAHKLESLRRCIARVEDKTPGSAQALADDADLQDILTLNLTRAVQICVDIGSHMISQTERPAPTTMGQVFQSLQALGAISSQTAENLKKAVGFRNIAVHNYSEIDWQIVHSICTEQLSHFREFAREITNFTNL